jgi:hypothetical protein
MTKYWAIQQRSRIGALLSVPGVPETHKGPLRCGIAMRPGKRPRKPALATSGR